MKSIFIYYSLSGNGDIIAEFLKHTHDIRKVEVLKPLPKNKILQIIEGGFKATINYHDKLLNFNDNIDYYDEIIIGSPIWNDRLCSPINSVLDTLKLNGKKVKFILYSGSGKAGKASNIIKDKYTSDIFVLKEPLKYPEELNKLKEI